MNDGTTAEEESPQETPTPMSWEYDVRHYDILLELDAETLGYKGVITMFATPREGALDCVQMHAGSELSLNQVLRMDPDGNYEPMNTIRMEDTVRHCDGEMFPMGEEFVLQTEFEGTADERTQYGIFTVPSEGSDLPSFFTQFESQGARLSLPLYDEPYDKATTTMTLIGDPRYRLLSNGAPSEVTLDEEGRQQITWDNPDPISTYLITLVAAELEELESEFTTLDGRLIPLSVYTEPGHREDGEYAMASLEYALEFFESHFGLIYPWDRYGIVALPNFRYGGMENKGLTNIVASAVYWNDELPASNRYGIFGITAHELAHEWFGNLVTMDWWQDIWLNEGFASFLTSTIALTEFDPLRRQLNGYVGLQRGYMETDSGPFGRAMVSGDYTHIDQLFDSISYTKGGKVLEMLQALMGESSFRIGLLDYAMEFDRGNSVSDQFISVMQRYTEHDLSRFSEGWIYRSGYPLLSVSSAWDAASDTLSLTVEQENAAGSEGTWLIPLPVGIQGDRYDYNEVILISEASQVFEFVLAEEPSIISINRDGLALIDYDIADLTIDDLVYQVRFDNNLYNRGVALYKAIDLINDIYSAAEVEGEEPPELEAAFVEALHGMLLSDHWPLRGFALARVKDGRLDEALRDVLSELAVPAAIEILETPHSETLDMVEIGVKRGAISLLGEVDVEHRRLERISLDSESRTGLVLSAVAALLESSFEDKFSVHEDVIERLGDIISLRRQLVVMLARVSEPEVLDMLRGHLNDTEAFGVQNQRVQRDVFRTLVRSSPELAYSEEGLALLLDLAVNNLDRPGWVSSVVRSFEGFEGRTDEEIERLRGFLTSLRESAEAQNTEDAVTNIDTIFDALLEREETAESEPTASPSDE